MKNKIINIPELKISISENDKNEFTILKKSLFNKDKVLFDKNTKSKCVFKNKDDALNYILKVYNYSANKLIDQNPKTFYEYEDSGLFVAKNLLGQSCVAQKNFSGKYLIQYVNYWNIPVIKDNEKEVQLAIPYIIRG